MTLCPKGNQFTEVHHERFQQVKLDIGEDCDAC